VDTDYGLRGRCDLFLVAGRDITDCRVQSLAIVEAFDEAEERCPGGLTSWVWTLVELGLQAAEKLSIGALSQQSPLRLMEHSMPCSSSSRR
jgi:hypothetical protein